ncbi:Iron transport multicopper oxidase FET3 [Daldinia childiae]|uniref:Iron transport multicopper oxidase FET3 n=1 Tax=Daldinia childiae TaxID=326645 RepID=UPI00144695FB|nr:Iron transport multicopper oxidase FET3 [Daldinia childiae]KAF3058203.1 Iron transport multicopper oxidase FET3 [Daldinia childiae]
MHRGCLPLIIALAQATGSSAKTVKYDWNVTWVFASPDGFGRPVIGINDVWPCPTIEADVGDFVSIDLNNKLGNETTGLHFHGINQINTNSMDGAVGTNQCPLPPDHSVRYRFYADAPGTYWYHSHSMGQYPDGFRGPLIIHDPDDPYQDDYDEEVILTLSDWYRDQTPTLMEAMINPNNTQFAPPLPNSTLVNDGGDGHVSVEAGKTYRFRIINWSAMFSTFLSFDSLDMDVIAIDASYVQRQSAQQLRISAAQRFDALITIPEDADRNYPYLVALDVNQDFADKNPPRPLQYPYNVTGMLVTDSDKDTSGTATVQKFEPFDDTTFQPHDNESVYEPVDKQLVLNFDYCFDANDYPRACFNDTTYIAQKVPALYTAASLGENNTETVAYGQVNPFVVEYGEILEIVVNNNNDAIHPFHLHGHQFQVLARPESQAGNWSANATINDIPPRRDTVAINPKSYAVFRIKAENPGVFLFHCHVEWHVEMGLTITLIEAPDKLRNYTIPQDHLDACDAMGIPTTGNAAGNEDWANTDGFVTVPPTTYTGSLYTESS